MDTPAELSWAATARQTLEALQMACVACEWDAARAQVDDLCQQLARSPATPNGIILDIFREAQDTLDKAHQAATIAREATTVELQTVLRGRKAVTAYG
jgi:hypothetical protein